MQLQVQANAPQWNWSQCGALSAPAGTQAIAVGLVHPRSVHTQRQMQVKVRYSNGNSAN